MFLLFRGNMKPEEKYSEDKEYPGNCPFLRHNQEEYLKEKESDGMRKEEKAEGKINGKA
jgi:hypothetical protein